MDLLLDAQLWASLLTLTALEIVLGIDNLIFISIVSGRLFLLPTGTAEIHATVEGVEEEIRQSQAKSFRAVIAEILLLDIVFSLDSVITAVGMARHLPVMAGARVT